MPVAERNGLGPPRAGLGLGGQTTMAEPARRNADGPAPDDLERKPDPRAGGWADVSPAGLAGRGVGDVSASIDFQARARALRASACWGASASTRSDTSMTSRQSSRFTASCRAMS